MIEWNKQFLPVFKIPTIKKPYSLMCFFTDTFTIFNIKLNSIQ